MTGTIAVAIQRALSAANCTTSTGRLRLRLAFGGNGAVERVESVTGTKVLRVAPDCVRNALEGLRRPGVRGGWVIVDVEW